MCYSKLKWRKFNPSDKFISFANELNSIAKLTYYITNNFKYKADNAGFWGDKWKTPEEIWEDGYGDCEDHAIFCLYIISKIIKKEANMITYTGYYNNNGKTDCNGHAVCIFQEDNEYNKWGVFSNNNFFYFKGTVEDIGRKWYPKGLRYMEVINDNGKTVQVKLPKYILWGVF